MTEEWHPGSFTKNFSWGGAERGLKELYDIIRIGFDKSLLNAPRHDFRQRVEKFDRPVYIPLNFFLLNSIQYGVDFVVIDELVFQALSFRHSNAFDKLALFAFNLSSVGHWRNAAPYQAKPALWANHYLSERVGIQYQWNSRLISADDIEEFVAKDARYRAKTSRKLATNLNYLYKQGKISEYRSTKPERWWLSALFLALDRYCEEIISKGQIPQEDRYEEYLIKSGFHSLSGPRSMQKDLAAHHFVKLYKACGGRARFSEDAVRERQKILVPDIQQFANNPEPVGVVHPSDLTARNAIPRACAILASYAAGFELLDVDELDNFDIGKYIKSKTQQALQDLGDRGVKSSMSAEDILAITREK